MLRYVTTLCAFALLLVGTAAAQTVTTVAEINAIPQGQIDQLSKVFALRGSITEQNWPEANKLPDFMEFSRSEPEDLSKVFPMMTKEGLNLMEKML